MIWWEGRGGLGVIILLGSFIFSIFGAEYLVQQFPDQFPASLLSDAIPIGWAIGGMTCWILGRRWNRSDEPGLDGNLFESIRDSIEDADHTILFLPMEYWGALSVSLAMLFVGISLIKWLIAIF